MHYKIFIIFILFSASLHADESPFFELVDGDILPKETVEEYGTIETARVLVKRLQKQESNKRKKHYDYLNDTYIVMIFPDIHLPSIIENGFKNQHQVGHSRGGLTREYRSQTENELIGLRLEEIYDPSMDNLIHELRPKYAYMVLEKPLRSKDRIRISGDYGNITVVISDSVKTRATFTNRDSLYMSEKAYTYSYSSRIRQSNTYWETQIWGRLDFSHVKYILIGCWYNTIPLQQDTFLLLKELEIPIYTCKKNRKTGGPTKGVRL